MNIVTRVTTSTRVDLRCICRAIAHAENEPDLFERTRKAVALCYKIDGSPCLSLMDTLAFTLTVAPETRAAVWQLADDPASYPDIAGWFILVSPDGEDELAGPWPTEHDARLHAAQNGWTLVPLND